MERILIVDDNEENLYFLQSLFGAAGYEVAAAHNGADALSIALAAPPDLCISDILMPGMDGFTFCRRWHNDAKLSPIPFAFYTATYTDPKDKELGLSIGAVDFLVKPIEPDAMLQVVRELLQKKQNGAAGDHSTAPAESEVFLREYNAALIRKLEHKLVQLEATNQSLAVAEEFVRTVLDNSPLPIVATDLDGRITFVNPAFSLTFGYSLFEAKGALCSEIIDVPGDTSETDLLAQQLSGEGTGPRNVRRKRKDGAIFDAEVFHAPLRVRGNVIGLLTIYRDVAERRKLEEQLRQAQKLEAVGQLAAGVAHDFNNLLSIMVGYSDLICLSAEPQSRLFHHAEQIGKACSRATTLTKQLLAFSRRQVLLPQVISLASQLEEMTRMLRRVTRENIELVVNIKRPVGKILVDPVQVEQVVLNLVTNACDAMPMGGRLSIDLWNVKIDETQARMSHPLRAQEYARLAVSDTGTGMDEATCARIFEPFFTTKSPGAGTGLGLASVHGIVEQSGGAIRVASEPGRGSCFEIFFPLVQASAASTLDQAKASPIGGGESILVAEDDEVVRSLVCEMLTSLGYKVSVAASATDAARMLQDTQRHIDLLITDVIMPKLSGRELSGMAWSSRPELRVLYVSGYQGELIPGEAGQPGLADFLPKPFSQFQLADAVRRILDSERPKSTPGAAQGTD